MDTGAHPCPQLSKAGVTPCGIAAEAEPHAVPHLKQHTNQWRVSPCHTARVRPCGPRGIIDKCAHCGSLDATAAPCPWVMSCYPPQGQGTTVRGRATKPRATYDVF